MTYKFIPKGICSNSIEVTLEEDIVRHVVFEGGCQGNLRAISKLVVGKTVSELEGILSGITCGSKSTSCSDQLVKAVKEAYKKS